MGLFDAFTKKKAATPKASEKRSFSNEELNLVAQRLKRLYGKPSYHIGIDEHTPSLTCSKFGGYPYWPEDVAYPTSPSGEKLVMLAQINFAEVKPGNELFPRKGLLQFFIEAEDLYGMGFDSNTKQDTFQIVFHPDIDPAVTLETVQGQNIPANTNVDKNFNPLPLYGEWAIVFGKTSDTLNMSLDEFQDAAAEAFETELGVKVTEGVWKLLDSKQYSYLSSAVGGEGHKLLGYPCFVQGDSRTEIQKEHYDTVLLQMDSDVKRGILWGDCGIGNFLINSEDLRKLDFTNVMYTWDCG